MQSGGATSPDLKALYHGAALLSATPLLETSASVHAEKEFDLNFVTNGPVEDPLDQQVRCLHDPTMHPPPSIS